MGLKAKERQQLLQTLQARFDAHRSRHPGWDWCDVQTRLEQRPTILKTLQQMEATGGEPDVVELEPGQEDLVFCDCASESPAGRRSLCYDAAARMSRKEQQPQSSAVEIATELGVELLTEEQYRALQRLGEFDLKTSSWISTPPEVRELGGALFCDRRYGRVFVYHNGAQSYYAARGFRGIVRV